MEEGLDEGGVAREFFMLLTKEILDVNYGMFVYLPETRTYWFNQVQQPLPLACQRSSFLASLGRCLVSSLIPPPRPLQISMEPDINFRLVGILFGLAIYNNVILDIHLPMVNRQPPSPSSSGLSSQSHLPCLFPATLR